MGNFSKRVLLVIDMQNDFIDGALGTKEAVAIVENVKKKIEMYRQNGGIVIFTRDTHGQNYLEMMEGKKLPVKHCLKNTKGWEITSEIDTAGDKIIDKPTFGSIELAEYLETLEEVEVIEIVGLCTDICVITNAMIVKAKLPEKVIVVDSSCCAGVTPESHLNALKALQMCHIEVR